VVYIILEFLQKFNPIEQALFATLFTWGVTALGSALVFFFKTINKKVFDTMLGFAAGVMIAASFWSLIAPGLELAEEMNYVAWAVAAGGFMSGGLFLFLVDKVLPHMHLGLKPTEQEGPKTSWQRSVLLVTAITLHNIPEGLAVGVAFGAAAAGIESATLASAVVLSVGIGLQNFPEGAAVSIPLRREGMSRTKAFIYGQASGIVEPISGVLGALLVLNVRAVLPFALCFAAGAMIFVVAEELIPEAQSNNNSDYATMGVLVGFTIMMILDVALG
jgi:ZIP family zinc transporter